MSSFDRILISAMLLISTMWLAACDNNSGGAHTAATPEDLAVSPESASTETSPTLPIVDEKAAEHITVTKAKIRATAPGQRVSGAFMTLVNDSVIPYALTSVSFDAASIVEIHETSMTGNMMKMRQVSQIAIPAHGSVELKPGSYHVMLMGLEKGLMAGTTETLTLTFSDNSQKTVKASVGDLSE